MKNLLFSVFQDERFMDLTIYQYGYEKCEPLHSFGPYVRNNYLFHYVMSGKGRLHANDEAGNTTYYDIEAGNGFIIEPGYVNTYYADNDQPWEYIWVEFGGLRAKECMELAGLSYKTPVYSVAIPEYGPTLQERMMTIVRSQNASNMERIGHLYLFMDCLIKYSASKKQLQGGKLSEFYAREAVVYIEHNYNKDITVEDIAQKCKLDRSYFGKVFKKVVGESPQEFLIHYRMTKAADALITGDESIGDIGMAVGYPNLLHFSRAFKGVYGVSPREYRQKNKIIDSYFS
ncbi:MAG: AraC family transcriptional regulator [Dorea sp.]|jgi:AraC-like DNA-binding protein|nr:AraC family transcriptional regulator [Dorea sp.]